MYKKNIISLCLLFISPLLHAVDITPWLELKPSYFFFVDDPFNDVYDDGGFEIQGSLSCPVCSWLDLYGSIGYRKAWGNALNTCEKTSVTIVPVDIGLKPVFNFCDTFYYFFAIGPRYFYLHQHNSSTEVPCIINDNSVGLFINTGFNFVLCDHFLLGIFGEYSYEPVSSCCVYPNNVYSTGNTQVGGFAFGISLGYLF